MAHNSNSGTHIDFDQMLREAHNSAADSSTASSSASASIHHSDVALTFEDFNLPQVEASDIEHLLPNDPKKQRSSTLPSSSSGPQPTAVAYPAFSSSATTATEGRFWRLDFYRSYFDVDTNTVLARLWQAVWPFSPASFTKFDLERPDLYGPFWISTTLVMIMAIMSNLNSYLNNNALMNEQLEKQHGADLKILEWSYDFRKVTVGASVMYTYVIAVPVLLWMLMKHKGVAVSLVGSVFLYGYSFAVLVPVSVICVLPIGLVQWAAVLVGFSISALFIILNLFPAWKQGNAPFVPIFVGYVSVAHLLLMFIYKLYFF